jgi:hypothetical protein
MRGKKPNRRRTGLARCGNIHFELYLYTVLIQVKLRSQII